MGVVESKTQVFSLRKSATGLVVHRVAVLDANSPPLSLFAHFQTMCPELCVSYTTVRLEPITRGRDSERARPCMFYGWHSQSLRGRLHDSFRATAPRLPSCCCCCSCACTPSPYVLWQSGRQTVLLALTVTVLIIEVLSGASVLPCAVSVPLWWFYMSTTIQVTGELNQLPDVLVCWTICGLSLKG